MHLVFCTRLTDRLKPEYLLQCCVSEEGLHTSYHNHNNESLHWVTTSHFEGYAFPEKQLIKRIFPPRKTIDLNFGLRIQWKHSSVYGRQENNV